MTQLENFGYREQLKRTLTVRDLVIYGMVFMVPISPFGVYGFVAADAKGMVPLAYVVGLFGMFFTAISYASMSRAFPVAGSVYTYVGRGLNDIAGFLAGWLILLDYIFVPALLYLFTIVALRPLVPTLPDWAWLLGFVSFNAVVNLLGIGFTARVNIGMLAFQLVTLGIFVILGLIALYHGQGAGGLTLRPIYDPAVFSMGTIVGATSIAVLSFLGFDGISTLAEESRGGEGAVARATLVSLLLVGALFVLQTWIAADLARGMSFASPETAFYEIAGRAGGTRLRLLAIIANSLANLANAIVAQAAVSRILFAMARDGKLPAALARVHSRYRTPHVSTLLVAGVSLAVGLLFASHLDDLTRLVNFGALTGFLLLHVAVVNHYVIRARSRAWFRHLCAPIAGFMVIAYVLYEMDSAAKIMGATWIVVGIAYLLVLTRLLKKPAKLDLGA